MVNLNECKLGEKLKMRNGELAIYVGRDPHCSSHFVVCNNAEYGYAMIYANDDGFMEYCSERSYDIIGKWKEKEQKI